MLSDLDAFFYYPDAFVTCDPRDREDRYVKRHPKLIAEVLSPSTAQFDQGEKFQDYQSLTTLEEYILIAQEEMRVESRRPQGPEGPWARTVYGAGDRVILQSVGLEIAIATLYRGVNLP